MIPITGASSCIARCSSSASCASTSASMPSSSAYASRRAAVASSRSRRISSIASAPASRSSRSVLFRREEALAEKRRVGRRARGAEVVDRPGEALVDEHRDRRGAGARELRRELRGIGVGAQVARGRRAPLHLGDRPQARLRECVGEPHAAAFENAISSSSRAVAAPESTASRASSSPSRRSSACPPAAIAPAAFSRIALAPAALLAREDARGSAAAFSAGDAAGELLDACSARGRAPRDRSSAPARRRRRPRRRGSGPTGDSSSIPSAPCTTNARCAPSCTSASAIGRTSVGRVDADDLGAGAGGVRQRAEHVEHGTRSELAPDRRGVLHRRDGAPART